MKQEKRKYYYYPTYAPSALQVKGLLMYEWIILVVIIVFSMFLFGTVGLLVGILIAVAIGLLWYRSEGNRMNTMNQFYSLISYSIRQQMFIKKERSDTPM